MKIIFLKDVMMAPETGIKWTFHQNEGYPCTEKEDGYAVRVRINGVLTEIEAPKFLIGEYFYILNDFGERVVSYSN